MTYPPSQTLEQSLASTCPTTQHAAIIMAKRDAVGVAKYGKTVDQNPLSASEWAQHALEEAADGLKYAIRAKEEALKLEQEVQALRDKVTRLEADRLEHELANARLDAARYKYLRALNKCEFALLIDDCLYQDLNFDTEVDRRRNRS